MFDGASFDLVLAVDVFPYLVQARGELAARHVGEAWRVLRPGGTLAILNYRYGDDAERGRRELADFAARAGFRRLQEPRLRFRYWDGAVYLLRRVA